MLVAFQCAPRILRSLYDESSDGVTVSVGSQRVRLIMRTANRLAASGLLSVVGSLIFGASELGGQGFAHRLPLTATGNFLISLSTAVAICAVCVHIEVWAATDRQEVTTREVGLGALSVSTQGSGQS